ncbi:MAG: protein-glutamate O-methyltransferase CheR [Lentisphaeraceae bacterium]|nr:protein-glutamate O-methyltransferase CheR [Lentisphaeraceae bacterium]
MAKPIEISDGEFKKIAALVYEHFGITLNDSKKSLVVNRLNKLLRTKGFASFKQYHDHLLADKNGDELQELANSISTNHTYFNRESKHFDYYLREALPNVVRNIHDNDLRVWCCASSTGEEPYTLAMLQHEFFGRQINNWKAGLLASDISENALRKAVAGQYPADEVNKLPPTLKNNYFTKVNNTYVVKNEIKKDVKFTKVNLVKPFSFKKKFHIVFCRNVMIYFDQPTKDDLISRFYQWIEPGGYLFIGHSETIPRETCPFKYIMPAVYRKV